MTSPLGVGEIEEALVQRLREASTSGALGYRWGSCESYSGEIDESRIEELANRAPAVWVVFAGDRAARAAGDVQYVEAVFAVLVAARSLRNQAAARKGAGNRVGAYQLMDDAVALIDGRTLGLDLASAFSFRARRTLFTKRIKSHFAAVYAVEFTCRYALPRAQDALEDFTAVVGDWQLPNAPTPEPGEVQDDWRADPDDAEN